MKRRNRGNALLEVVGERFELLDFFGERADRRRAGVQAAIHRLLLLHHDRHAPRGKLLLLLELRGSSKRGNGEPALCRRWRESGNAADGRAAARRSLAACRYTPQRNP